MTVLRGGSSSSDGVNEPDAETKHVKEKENNDATEVTEIDADDESFEDDDDEEEEWEEPSLHFNEPEDSWAEDEDVNDSDFDEEQLKFQVNENDDEEEDERSDDAEEGIDMFLAAQEYVEDEVASEQAVGGVVMEDVALDENLDSDEGNEVFHDSHEYMDANLEPDGTGVSVDAQEVFEDTNMSDSSAEEDVDLDEEEPDSSDHNKRVSAGESASFLEPEFSGEADSEGETVAGDEYTEETGRDESEGEGDDIPDDYRVDEEDTMQGSSPAEESFREATEVNKDSKNWVGSKEVEEATTFPAASAVDESHVEIDISHQQSTDDDSMAFVDRMELADDEGEAVLNGLSGDGMSESGGREIIEDREDIQGRAVENEEIQYIGEKGTGAEPDKLTALVIDDEMVTILTTELNFSRQEVERMKPEIAAVLAKKKLQRPWEGIPLNWYKEDTPGKRSLVSRIPVPSNTIHVRKHLSKISMLPRYAVPIVLGGLAIYGYNDLAHMFVTLSADDSPRDFEEEEDEEPIAEGQEGISPLPHSLRDSPPSSGIPPGSKIAKGEDVTWLDKMLTKMSWPIRKFMSIEI